MFKTQGLYVPPIPGRGLPHCGPDMFLCVQQEEQGELCRRVLQIILLARNIKQQELIYCNGILEYALKWSQLLHNIFLSEFNA